MCADRSRGRPARPLLLVIALGPAQALALSLGLAGCAGGLASAARSGDLAAIDRRVAEGAEIDAQDLQGNTALYQAARAGHADAVERLIEAGADPDLANSFGSTAAHVAARYGHVEVIRALGRAGADLDLRNRGIDAGMRPLGSATGSLARGDVPGATPLMRAASAGQLEAAKALVEAGATLPAPDAIREAHFAGHVEIAAALTLATREARRAGRVARARYPASYPRRVAVVIGVSRYEQWPSLEGAAGDARRVADTLRELGFDQVIERYDGEATRTALLEVLGRDLAAAARPGDLAFVYFAGHGQTEGSGSQAQGYIIPVDGVPGEAYATGISMASIRELGDRVEAGHVYFAMDSCYSGLGLVTTRAGTPGTGDRMRSAVQMLTAGTAGQQAIERGGRGLFTTYLLRALEGDADDDGDGVVTASEIGAFVSEQVAAASRNKQTPQYGTLEGSGEVGFALP